MICKVEEYFQSFLHIFHKKDLTYTITNCTVTLIGPMNYYKIFNLVLQYYKTGYAKVRLDTLHIPIYKGAQGRKKRGDWNGKDFTINKTSATTISNFLDFEETTTSGFSTCKVSCLF